MTSKNTGVTGTSSSRRNTASSSHGLSKCTMIVGGLFALFVAVFPMILSELIGGWTAKYTSPVGFTPSDIPDLTGRVAIVTGSNTGIGYYTALELARRNCHVIVASRSPTKGQKAVQKIVDEITTDNGASSEKVDFLQLDLSSLASVQKFVADFKALDLPLNVLILNAGIMKSPGSQYIGQNLTYGFDLTRDGFEAHIGVNHIGHYYLTRLLEDKLVAHGTRVVAVSSAAEEGAYTEGMRFEAWKPRDFDHAVEMKYEDGNAYGQSKLANILFARELASRLEPNGVTAYSLHPGVIKSELSRYILENAEKEMADASWFARYGQFFLEQFFELAMMETPDGALTQLHLATAPSADIVNGGFYHPIGRYMTSPKHPQGSNITLQQLLWTETERVILEAGYTI